MRGKGYDDGYLSARWSKKERDIVYGYPRRPDGHLIYGYFLPCDHQRLKERWRVVPKRTRSARLRSELRWSFQLDLSSQLKPMTQATKPVSRETLATARERGRSRPIVITIYSTFVKLRLKGMRRSVVVTMDQLWTMGNRNAAESARQEKLAAKKAAKQENRR
jgi:hypothetical protein